MKKDKQKTIFFATHLGFTTRYLLQTDIFKRLKEHGHRIVIISPNGNDERFSKDYQGDNIYIEQFNYEEICKIRKTYLYKFFTRLRRFTLPGKLDLTTLKVAEKTLHHRLKGKAFLNKILSLIPVCLSHFLRHSRFLRYFFVRIESMIFSKKYHNDLFEKYKPDMLVLADLGTIDISNFIMREARKLGVPIVSVILSWDHLTSKGMGGIKPDYAVAWNENMKWELENYHEIPSSHIFVGGIAHFDIYFRQNFPISEKEFRKSLGLSDGKKLLFYGTASPSSFKENLQVIHLLLNAVRDGRILEPVQLIVRVHPAYISGKKDPIKDELKKIQEMCTKNNDILKLNLPKMLPRHYGHEIPLYDQIYLGAMLKYSNVLLTQFSTLMLEAAFFDLPIINIGFDDYRKIGIKSSELCLLTHLKRILDENFTRTAENEEQLFDLINQYLQNPNMEAKKRKLIRRNEGGPNKGRAGAVIADYLNSLLSDLKDY